MLPFLKMLASSLRSSGGPSHNSGPPLGEEANWLLTADKWGSSLTTTDERELKQARTQKRRRRAKAIECTSTACHDVPFPAGSAQ